MACFANINVSQGNVATYARCGGIFNIHLTTNLPMNVRQSHGHESMAPLFGPPRTRSCGHREPCLRWRIYGSTRRKGQFWVHLASPMWIIGNIRRVCHGYPIVAAAITAANLIDYSVTFHTWGHYGETWKVDRLYDPFDRPLEGFEQYWGMWSAQFIPTNLRQTGYRYIFSVRDMF